MKRFLKLASVALVCAAALAASGWYVLDLGGNRLAKAAAPAHRGEFLFFFVLAMRYRWVVCLI